MYPGKIQQRLFQQNHVLGSDQESVHAIFCHPRHSGRPGIRQRRCGVPKVHAARYRRHRRRIVLREPEAHGSQAAEVLARGAEEDAERVRQE
ncbi:hypothetical protein D3C84_1138420 [compost metagenome]